MYNMRAEEIERWHLKFRHVVADRQPTSREAKQCGCIVADMIAFSQAMIRDNCPGYVRRAAGFTSLVLHLGATYAQSVDPENVPQETR